MKPPPKRHYGYIPDFSDHRDYLLHPTITALPAKVDRLCVGFSIDDQGQLGSCTGNATERALRILMKNPADYSRLMLYYNGRRLEGTTAFDSGCMIRDVIKGVRAYGACPETEWPYTISKFTVMPSAQCYTYRWGAASSAHSILSACHEYDRPEKCVGQRHSGHLWIQRARLLRI